MVIHHKVSPFAILTKFILHADYDDKTHFEIFPFLRFFQRAILGSLNQYLRPRIA